MAIWNIIISKYCICYLKAWTINPKYGIWFRSCSDKIFQCTMQYFLYNRYSLYNHFWLINPNIYIYIPPKFMKLWGMIFVPTLSFSKSIDFIWSRKISIYYFKECPFCAHHKATIISIILLHPKSFKDLPLAIFFHDTQRPEFA